MHADIDTISIFLYKRVIPEILIYVRVLLSYIIQHCRYVDKDFSFILFYLFIYL